MGAAASIIAALLSQRNQRRQEELANSRKRSERARDFQAEALVAAQDALDELRQSISLFFRHHSGAVEGGYSWRDVDTPGDLEERVSRAIGKVHYLSERVQDPDTRADLELTAGLFSEVLGSRSLDDARVQHDAATKQFIATNTGLGVVLRGLFDPVTRP